MKRITKPVFAGAAIIAAVAAGAAVPVFASGTYTDLLTSGQTAGCKTGPLQIQPDGSVICTGAGPITAVGSLEHGGGSSATTWTASLDPATAGDIEVLEVANYSTKTVTSVSGGGVGTWNVVENNSSGAYSTALVWGVVQTPGTANATITFSGTASGAWAAQEFSATNAVSWNVDGSPAVSDSTGTSLTFASLAPSGAGEMYIGSYYATGGAISGIPAGYTNEASGSNGLLFDTAVTGEQSPAVTAPTSTSTNVSASVIIYAAA